jgi:hypothetical protein
MTKILLIFNRKLAENRGALLKIIDKLIEEENNKV